MGEYIPRRYIPSQLTKKDREKQRKGIEKSRRLYHKGIYIPRPHVSSFKSKPSRHVRRAKAMYGVNIGATPELAKASGCSMEVLKAILRKGEGAYYSGGSRPNQTAQSWALARLASSLTGGKSSKVDFHLIRKCNKTKKAYRYANPLPIKWKPKQ